MARTKGSKNKVKKGQKASAIRMEDESFFSDIGRMGGENKGKKY